MFSLSFIYSYISLFFSSFFFVLFNFRGLFCKSLISEIDFLDKDYYYLKYEENSSWVIISLILMTSGIE